MCSKVNWIVEYNWNLLFDLNYKFINGSLAFGLAKSI